MLRRLGAEIEVWCDASQRGAAVGEGTMIEHGATHVYFGLSPLWVATVILLVTYAVVISEKINRSIVALIGATLMILVGVMDQAEALKGIDWNTIGLLTGMMILVSI